MHWYDQRTGRVFRNLVYIGLGYSGSPEGKNDPQKEDIPDVGPIPKGVYKIGQPEDTAIHGPYVLRLFAAPENEMYKRDGFLIHGDSVEHPGAASQGCIVLERKLRQQIWESGDHLLVVYST